MNGPSLFRLFGCVSFFILLGILFFFLLPVLIPVFLIAVLFLLFNARVFIRMPRKEEKKDDDVIDVEVLESETSDAQEPAGTDQNRLPR